MAKRAAVLLFALNLNPHNRVGRRFDALLKKYLQGAWRMTCPPLTKRGIKGESKYHAEIVLAARPFLEHGDSPDIVELRTRLEDIDDRSERKARFKAEFPGWFQHQPR